MTESIDLALRAFMMSGAQITSELQQISIKHGVNISKSNSNLRTRKHEDYANFEKLIRKNAIQMSEYYEIFYCLETSIRNLISNTMIEAEGPNWWTTSRVAIGIRNEVNAIRSKEESAGVTTRSDNMIEYTTFGQLSQLITDNFVLFEPIISSKSAVSRVLNQLNLLRGPIAHCCYLAEDEQDRLSLAVKDWFRLLS